MVKMSARRAVGQFRIREWVKLKWTGAEMIRALKLEGISYKRPHMLDDIRTFKGVALKSGRARYIGLDKLPASRVIVDSYTEFRTRYINTVKYEATNRATGLKYTKYINIGRDTLMTRRTLERIAKGLLETDKSLNSWEIEGIMLYSVTKAI